MGDATNILTSLKIIAQIRQHDKVSTRGDTVRVDNQYLQALRRYVNGESREINLLHMSEIFAQAFELLRLKKQDNDDVVNRLEVELLNAKKGLENLKSTYAGDSVSRARLDVIIDQLNDKVKEKEDETEKDVTI
jgi:hypothetical protein